MTTLPDSGAIAAKGDPAPARVAQAPAGLRAVFSSRTDTVMLAANVMGVALYLWRASDAWADPIERAAGVTTLTGEPFIWFAAIFPVVVACALLNVGWLAYIVVTRQRRSILPMALGALLWIGGIVVDFARH